MLPLYGGGGGIYKHEHSGKPVAEAAFRELGGWGM